MTKTQSSRSDGAAVTLPKTTDQRRKPFEIDVKRFYIPGVESPCPKCGEVTEPPYLSYPTANDPESVGFYCGDCDHEWTKMVTVHCYAEVLDD